MAIVDDLIDIYAANRTDDVGADARFVKLCKDNDSDNVFHATRNRIERVKRQLEEQAAIQKTYRKQAKLALKLYHQLIGSEDQEDVICLRLVHLAYFPKWSDKQKAYFDKTCLKIQEKSDYFLSFTQRNPPGASNPVNLYHRHLILSHGNGDPKDSSRNELAGMLNGLLRTSKYQFRGFFYPEHEDNSAKVIKKLRDGIDECLVFVQLVQNEMFSKSYDAEENYCFMEYTEAVNQQKKMILLFADGKYPSDLITDESVQFDLGSWHKFIKQTDCLDLAPTRVAEESANIQPNLEKLKLRLVEEMYGVRLSLWEGVPGDLD
jgi:hypothetical protein